MQISHAAGRPLLHRYRVALVALFALFAVAVSMSSAAQADAAGFDAYAYNSDTGGFMCPVETRVHGTITRSYDEDGRYIPALEVRTSTTTGYNGYIFAACRAYVYVDVIAQNGHTMVTFPYEPWAGPLSTHNQHWVERPGLPVTALERISKIEVRQYPRTK